MFIENYPRKPFLARGSNVNRCDQCLLAVAHCICDQKITAEVNVEFWLLMHREEAHKPTNTGRLIEDILPGQTRRFYWHRTEPDPEFISRINSEKYEPHIIFPDDRGGYEERVRQKPENSEGKIQAFIILDGSWRQAGRMFRLSKYLQDLLVLPIKSQRESRYKLRKAPDDFHLCTVEVALAVLEMCDEKQGAVALDNYFEIFNNAYALSRRREAP